MNYDTWTFASDLKICGIISVQITDLSNYRNYLADFLQDFS